MIKFSKVQMIEVSDWDQLVEETYGRTYSFQQQNGCQERGTHEITVPDPYAYDYEQDTIPEVVNGDEMGVSFASWLSRDPKEWNGEGERWEGMRDFDLRLWWKRNFYPSIDMIANDLHAKGLLPAGDYVINIDW